MTLNSAFDETATPLPLTDGLTALIAFARQATSADVAIAFEAGIDGVATPLASEPEISPRPFSLAATKLVGMDWAKGPAAADSLNLPSAILSVLERPVHEGLFINTPATDAPLSGILFLWYANPPAQCDCPFRRGMGAQVGQLASVFSQMLSDRRTAIQRRIASDRFQDLFGSVPAGIVVLEGNGHSGLVNETAAALLGIASGELPAFAIAAPMRTLRERCENSVSLTDLYGRHQANIDYAVKAIWDLGEHKYEVDTHPILGNGRNGRIWLFNDVTAQHVVEQNLRNQALTDPLTGLNNRRYFTDAGAALMTRTLDGSRNVTAMMIDIDRFKSVNDRYGHAVGDEVLRTVSSRIRGALREQDLIARFGGEEFVVLIDGFSLADAERAAERLRTAIARDPVPTMSGPVPITVSIGIAERLELGQTLDELLLGADRALYAAKAAGRDRVMVDRP